MRIFHRSKRDGLTNPERLLDVLSDHKWHCTSELVRAVSHVFGRAKWTLIGDGRQIEKRRHPTKPREWEYRLLDAPKR